MFSKEILQRMLLASLYLVAWMPVQAQASEEEISAYPAAFFAPSHPSTANDMVQRLPGFSLNTGLTARGYAGTGSNILVDGARPTAKTDDVVSILNRIPAASVERIEIIRGGAPGMDMQGQSIVANIVRRKDGARSIILTSNSTLIGDGSYAPGGILEYHGEREGKRYDLSLSRTTQAWDDAPGNGYRLLLAPGGVPQYDAAGRRGIMRLGYAANGTVALPLWGGQWTNNATLQTANYSSGVFYTAGAGARFDSVSKKRNGEFGSRWEGPLGGVTLETLVLQRLGREDFSNTSAQSSGSADFRSLTSTGETIARATVRYSLSPDLDLRAGSEIAYNVLNSRSSYVAGGLPIILPNANIRVEERRGEVFAETTWRIMPGWTLEGSARLEYSTISESSGSGLSRSFFYPKPRLLLSWAPDARNQARLRIERTVGQLNFTDFAASSNLAGYGVAAGNSNLRPDQRWQYEMTVEKHFWGKGALVISALHEEIEDLQDFVPVGGGLDAPGNIPRATSDKLTITGTIPLDWLGLEKGLLKPNLYWNTSSVTDPVTGENRRISNQRDRNISLELTQDLDSLGSTWLLGIMPGSFSRTTWRISQVSRGGLHAPYIYASWTWKPAPDWSLLVQADNALPYRFELRQYNYAGPRNVSPPPTLQDTFSRTETRLFIQLRKTFD